MTMLCEAFGLQRSTFKYRRAAEERINPDQLKINAMVKAAQNSMNGPAGAPSITHVVTG